MSIACRNDAASASNRSTRGLFELLLTLSLFALQLQLIVASVLLELCLAPHPPFKFADTAFTVRRPRDAVRSLRLCRAAYARRPRCGARAECRFQQGAVAISAMLAPNLAAAA